VLLARLGIEFEILDTGIEEQGISGESPTDYVCRIALEKARAGKDMAGDGRPVLAADTEVILNGSILGKPRTVDEAVNMLLSLSGRVHEVYTAVVLLDRDGTTVLNRNRVWFRALSRPECEQYCRSGEPFDKAGGYGIQGRAAAFIRRLEGSYSGVMGLPLRETRELLQRCRQQSPGRERDCNHLQHGQ